MKNFLAFLVLSVGLVTARSPAILSAPYDGVQVLRVPTGNSTVPLDRLIAQMKLDRWTTKSIINSHIDVQVPAELVQEFKTQADAISRAQGISNIAIETMHEDLGESIRLETEGMFAPKENAALIGLASNAWFNTYHTFADHQTWLSDMVATFPSNSRIFSVGNSLQGRPINGLQIYGSSGPNVKPAIIFHGTVHAREWISTMVNEYIAYNLLNNYANSTEVKAFVDKYDFFIVPVVNPDGFVFTQSTTRLWRKNRSTPPSGTCYGTDINRNWAHSSWAQASGASTNPCAEDYKGTSAASAPETKVLAAFNNARANSAAGAKMYIDWHSYSQLFMTPYGYSCTAVAADRTELNRLAAGFGTALRAVSGTTYSTGPICTTIYPASGGSTDYAYDNSRIKYSFAAELRDTGANGFVLPAAQIRPSGLETWAGVRYLLANIV